MKLEKIAAWLDKTLKVADFDDVSNNGLQVEREEGRGKSEEVRVVAFAVDASVKNVKAAAKAGAQLLVVHHGISWGGGIKRISGGVYNVVKAAMDANLAVYACHLPLDAHPVLGNNAQLAKLLKLKNVKQAFSYHGNVIGVVGEGLKVRVFESLKVLGLQNSHTFKLSNLQTLKPSNFQTFKPSNFQTFKLSTSSRRRLLRRGGRVRRGGEGARVRPLRHGRGELGRCDCGGERRNEDGLRRALRDRGLRRARRREGDGESPPRQDRRPDDLKTK